MTLHRGTRAGFRSPPDTSALRWRPIYSPSAPSMPYTTHAGERPIQAISFTSLAITLLHFISLHVLSCRYEQLGMYTAMRSLELDDHIREHYMNSSLLHPSEHAFLNSDLPPIEVLTSSEPDPLLRQASKRRISLSSRSHSNTSTSKPLIVEGGVWVNDAEVQNRYASHYVARSIWESVFGMTEQSFYKAKEYLLPIDYASDIQFLRACVYVSEKLGKAELFDNEVVYCAVEMAWRLYGRAYHLTLSALYFVLLACVTVTNYRLHDWIVSSDVTLFTLVITLMCAVLFLNALFVLNIASQIMEEYAENRLIAYLSDAQNIIEIGSHVIVFVAFAMRCTSRNETLTSASIMAVATVLLWFKALYYLRPFKSTGPLVRMIFFIFTSIQELSIILIIVIFGFSQAMYLLSYQNDSLDFASPYNGIINAFIYMMGNPLVEQAASTSDPSLAQFLLCTFMFASTILLLNLLIALMNNSYNTIKSKATAEWNRERAKIMIEQWRPWGAVVHRYSYYLVRVDDRADMIKTRAEATDSRLERVEAKVDALLAAIKGMQSLQHDAIEGMKAGLSKGIA